MSGTFEKGYQYMLNQISAMQGSLEHSLKMGQDRLTIKQLHDILRHSENISIACRTRLHEHDQPEGEANCGLYIANEDVEVSVRDMDGFISIRVPFFLNRKAQNAWYLKRVVQAAVRKYVLDGGTAPDATKRLVLAFIRMESGIRDDVFDNDNEEAHQTGDGIMRGFGLSDRAYRVQYYFSTIVTNELYGQYIFVVSEEKFASFIDWISKLNTLKILPYKEGEHARLNLNPVGSHIENGFVRRGGLHRRKDTKRRYKNND